MDIVDDIVTRFKTQGDAAYFGEAVSQREHALQAAYLAEQEAAPDSLIVAALLHDIGHLLHDLPENVAEQGIDASHETVGALWLERYFRPDVSEPARLHVAAKRYLCATEPDYLARLSPASLQSLRLQNGPMTQAEVQEFAQNPYYEAAIRLRQWDDTAKIPGLPVPDVAHYRARVLAALR